MIKLEVEGTDGAGKTTGLKYMLKLLESKGLKAVETREVGNPHIQTCVKLREIVLSPESNMSGESMELVFGAMRLENDRWLKELSEKNDKPDVVVSDRGWLSHLAYTDHNVSVEFTQMLYDKFLGSITSFPDAIVYFSVSPEVALQRRIRRGEVADAIELKGVEFQDKVRRSFDKYIQLYADKIPIYRIDANQPLELVQQDIERVLEEIISSQL